ncbi:natural cytotoxicity triggering receptor 1-like [Perognathus longimembris pacificus]|uniref:natural cytotoxicity triggering receptor 1-like n=1 Tax=Perognathus longimembris pacificus TaxID=214514 RepID=UPI00201941DB|nr:natural cytotoxicity triggering receptor 1-like [Perognathus longimembris pacificus]
MLSTLAALLCVGLCLSKSSSQTKTLSKPAIWAKPSHTVPVGSQVEIWCRGAPDAREYHLHFEGGHRAVSRTQTPGSMNKGVSFPMQVTPQSTAGQYRCLYSSGELWSEYSDPLDLVVTGLYDTPTLTVHPRPDVALGEPVTFRCQLETATNTFFLLKEGQPSHTQRRSGNLQADFPLGPATRSHRGTYRCFGSYNNHMWSFPSEPLRLVVTGNDGNTSFAPTDPPTTSLGESLALLTDPWQAYTSTPGWELQQAQNLLRIGLAFLVLVALAWLLAEDRLHRKRAQARNAGWGCRRRQTVQRDLDGHQELRCPRRARGLDLGLREL